MRTQHVARTRTRTRTAGGGGGGGRGQTPIYGSRRSDKKKRHSVEVAIATASASASPRGAADFIYRKKYRARALSLLSLTPFFSPRHGRRHRPCRSAARFEHGLVGGIGGKAVNQAQVKRRASGMASVASDTRAGQHATVTRAEEGVDAYELVAAWSGDGETGRRVKR